MPIHTRAAALTFSLFAAMPGLASAQETDPLPEAAESGLGGQGEALEAGPIDSRDGTFLRQAEGIDVVAPDGSAIGEIEGMLVDEAGSPAAFIVEIGGFLGIGDHDVALPTESLDYDGQDYVSIMTEEQLLNLPEWED